MMTGNHSSMPTITTTHELTCDVLVAGGGAAGVPCALAAARNGAKVILCQDRPVLGGNASSEVRMHIVGANGTGSFDRGGELQTEAREGGIIEEIRLETCLRNPQRSASMFDLILYEKCRAEPNLTLMLNTGVTGVEMDGDRIERVVAERQSTEDRFAICAKVFIDCTGDSRLGVEAAAPFAEGRESREQFSESLAPPEPDKGRLGSTILMQARRHEQPMPFVAPPWARKFSRHELRLRLYATPGEEKPTHEYGYWWAEWGGSLDTIKDNERIRDELLAIVLGVWDHVKNGPPEERSLHASREETSSPRVDRAKRGGDNDDPFEASHWALDWFGFLPGKRESRRLIGQHILTQQDVLASRPFDDAIAYGGWPLDLHPAGGVDAPDDPPCEQHPVAYLYDIPLRCCVSRDIRNLMFAGRNISATHVAFSSTRVMATCAVIGQGVGTAAAYAARRGLEPADLPAQRVTMQAIQQRLLLDDALLIGRVNEDPQDLARTARITATSEVSDGRAIQVVSGQTRSLHGERGAPPGRSVPATHRWMSDPAAGFPVAIQLEWPNAIEPRELHLIFDTGLHRHLTLSHHDGYTAQMQWGRPQPETVRDYTVDALIGDAWTRLIEVSENYQRRRAHRLDLSSSVTALRITVHRTNGLDHARICEIRVY